MTDSIRLRFSELTDYLAAKVKGTKKYLEVLSSASDGPSIDSFGRLRTSSPRTLFDSKQIVDNLPLLWDDQETSGSGTSSTHSTDRSSSTLAVSNLTAGTRIRQTFRRFNYESGKSHLIEITGVLGAAATGITRCFGYYDDNNGIFFEQTATALNVVIRSNTGSPISEDRVAQTAWNIDRLDGANDDTNPSGITLDVTKSQIFVIDMQWLAVGRVRLGLDVNGTLVYVHEFQNANNLDVAYMSTPNLPVRVEIQNDGTGAAASVEQICATVISEAGEGDTGLTRYISTGGTKLDANVVGTLYALIGMRLKSTHLDVGVFLSNISLVATTSDGFEWVLLFNPTIAVSSPETSFSDVANSAIQKSTGVTGSTVTGGTAIDGGYVPSVGRSISVDVKSVLSLGSAIDGTVDEIWLCVRPLGANADIFGSITYKEQI